MSNAATERSHRSRTARLIALVVFVIVAVLVLVLATRPAADTETKANPLVGSVAPPIAGTALDGRPVSLAALKGRWVVVNFFATWCVPCRNEHPQLKQFEAEHQGADSPTILAVAYDKNDLGAAKEFFAENGGNWPVVPDDGGRTAVSFGVRGLPESFVVDPDGRIVAQIAGEVTVAWLNSYTNQVS